MNANYKVFQTLSFVSRDTLTINRARAIALQHAPYDTDITEMAETGKFSYRYTYSDESQLIIDDEGFIYCDEDTEINVLCGEN